MNSDFFKRYRVTDMQPNEVIVSLKIPYSQKVKKIPKIFLPFLLLFDIMVINSSYTCHSFLIHKENVFFIYRFILIYSLFIRYFGNTNI